MISVDDYTKELLRKNLEVSQESLEILKKMNRARVMGGIFRILKWIGIIGISFGLYYYIEPYLQTLKDTLSGLNAGMEDVRSFKNLFP